jgi:DNA-directed RNA polymerase subunit beta
MSLTKSAPKSFARYPKIIEIPNLVEIQTAAYQDFLQLETPQGSRKSGGLESLLKEVFPIYSYDKTMCLEYIGYELGKPRYSIEECRQLRLTYGYPFKVRLRLIKPEPIEEEVYLGEIPVMIRVSTSRSTLRRRTRSCTTAGSFRSAARGSS